MNLQNILTAISQQDPEVYERLSPRRHVLKNFGRVAALTALPLALGSMFKRAYGKPTDIITDVLNFALKLEYMETEFYATGLAASGLLIPTTDRPFLELIRTNEAGHVQFLTTTITALGETPISKPTFDFTGGDGTSAGPFADVFTNYETFLAVAQTFENVGVRAYKGAAPLLMSQNDILEAALTIHSVEARHAAKLQMMRKANGHADMKPWITFYNSGIPTPFVQPAYNGEESTGQSGLQIVDINRYEISIAAASEAFDEPLTADAVNAIVDPFIV